MNDRERAQQHIAAAIEKSAGAKLIVLSYLSGMLSSEELDLMTAALEGKTTLSPDSRERRILSIARSMDRLTRLSD